MNNEKIAKELLAVARELTSEIQDIQYKLSQKFTFESDEEPDKVWQERLVEMYEVDIENLLADEAGRSIRISVRGKMNGSPKITEHDDDGLPMWTVSGTIDFIITMSVRIPSERDVKVIIERAVRQG